jgi:hypothetical protein
VKTNGLQKGKKTQVIVLQSRQYVYEDIDTERKEKNRKKGEEYARRKCGEKVRKGVEAGENRMEM